PEAEADEKAVHFPRQILIPWIAAAAAVFVLLAFGARSFLNPASADPVIADNPIATLLLAENCEWDEAINEGQRLAAGVVGLKSGTAVIRFDGGAELVLSGATEIELRNAGSGRLIRGDVIVRAVDGAEGFTLDTPASKVVDLGTEFAVRADASGRTELHVLDGRVRSRGQVLEAGKAVRFDSAAAEPREVELNSPRFEEAVRKVAPKPRADLMTAYSGFHYPPGELPLSASTKGKGWAGPWRLRLPEERRRPEEQTTPNMLQIVHGQMNVTWPVPGGRLGMLEMPPGPTFYVRELKKPIPMDRRGVWFFSLMAHETERPEKRSAVRFEAVRLTFRSSDNYFGEALSFGHGQSFRPRVQVGDGIGFTSPLLSPAEQTTLWVGKVVSRSNGEDEIYFRVYGESDHLEYAEPAVWHVVTRDVDLNARFDRILLSSTGNAARIVDELRIGPTWRSVVPFKPHDGSSSE
ncbi:MAG: FecR family protein, partial [Verrucomicrobiota bacterium]